MSKMDIRALNKLSLLLSYEMLEMREIMKERIMMKMKDENASTEEILEMMDGFITLHDVVDKEVKERVAGEGRARTFLDYRK